MRVLLSVLFLVLAIGNGLAQVDEEILTGSYIPVSVEQGAYLAEIINLDNVVLTLEKGTTGYFEMAGNNDQKISFSFQLQSDTVHLNSEGFTYEYFVISHLKPKSFVANYDKGATVKYQRLEKENEQVSIDEASDIITNANWIIRGDTWSKRRGYRFEPRSIDATDTLYFQPQKFPSMMTSSSIYPFELLYWSLGTHQDQLFMKLYTPPARVSFTDITFAQIKKLKPKEFKFYGWQEGKEYHFTARKIKPVYKKKLSKEIKWLTSKAWQIFEEQELPEHGTLASIDSDIREDDFGEQLVFTADSLPILTKSDIIEKRLILKYNPDGTYQVRRNEQVLDWGTWKIYGENTYIDMHSEKTDYGSDGIERMMVYVKEFKKNKLVITREVSQFFNKRRDYESKLEIYKPVKNH